MSEELCDGDLSLNTLRGALGCPLDMLQWNCNVHLVVLFVENETWPDRQAVIDLAVATDRRVRCVRIVWGNKCVAAFNLLCGEWKVTIRYPDSQALACDPPASYR